MTHAFFKALLFLGSGSVIHGMGGEQDIRKMGGLQRYMPKTYVSFLIGTLAFAGVPGLAGFFSKDQILYNAFAGEHGSPLLWALGAVGAGLTAFYMTRLTILTFWGECRADHDTQHHIHESPPSMVVPLMVLAFLSIVGGYVGLPAGWLWGDQFAAFLAPVFGGHHHHEHSVALEYTLMAASVAIAFAGIGLAYVMYVAQPGLADRLAASARGAYQLLLNKYFVDEAYDGAIVQPTVRASGWLWRVFDARLVDGFVNGTAGFIAANAAVWRRLQDGNVQHYALSFLVGVAAILGYYVWR
jgi:NADH-quinone oxidoreductase subunit L